MDASSPYEALETLLRLYENFALQRRALLNQATARLDYELKDLCEFVDQLFDLSVMVFNTKAAGYTCHGKPWIKGMLHVYLRKVAAAAHDN